MVAHLTGDRKHARLFLLNYARSRSQGRGGQGGAQGGGRGGGQPQESIRIRVLKRYRAVKFAAYGAADGAKLEDVENPGNSTEFTVPVFRLLAVIDLEVM